MDFSGKQRGVLRGMALGLVAAIGIVLGAILWNPFGYPDDLGFAARLQVAIGASLVMALFVAVSVGRLAKHRFISPEDMDGSGLTDGSARARILQSLLQNTLEQSMIAVPLYLCWATFLPASWLSTVPLAATSFAVGRLMFMAGYEKGAPARALGFTLTFYPSLVMLICLVAWLVVDCLR